MKSRVAVLAALSTALALPCLAAAEASSDKPFDAAAALAERQALGRQRAEFDALYANDQAACRERFAVSDCLDAARLRHSAAVDPLIRRQQALDSAERAAKARTAREQAASREAEAGAEAASRGKSSQSATHAGAPPPLVARPRSLPSEEERRQALAERDAKATAQANAQRARQAARRADLAQRQKLAAEQSRERAAKLSDGGRKPAAPLPEPSASAIEQFRAQSQGASAPR